MKAKSAILALAVGAALALPASAEIPANGAGLSGIYAGSYQCKDGEHGVLLDLKMEERPKASGLRVTGRLGFFPVLAGKGGEFADVAGSFTILGLLAENGRITFRHQDWLIQPKGYGAANFNGRVSRRADGLWQITGKPLAGPKSEFCSDMIATQFLPLARHGPAPITLDGLLSRQ